MAVTEAELAAILTHCRALTDVADEVDAAARSRGEQARLALRRWEGPHATAFVARLDEEAVDLAARARGLRAEAEAWATAWADAVDRINGERRRAAVDEIRSSRGFGESLVDLFVGDDSADRVRAHHPVPVPTAASRFAPTGGLETF